jgi:hypothetical protein
MIAKTGAMVSLDVLSHQDQGGTHDQVGFGWIASSIFVRLASVWRKAVLPRWIDSKGMREGGEGWGTKREMGESQDKRILAILPLAVFYTTDRILGRWYSPLQRSHPVDALASFLPINSCINSQLSKIHPRVPGNFQFRCGNLHWNLFASAGPEIERYGFRSLCVFVDVRLSVCTLCSVSGARPQPGRTLKYANAKWCLCATSRTPGCCNPATKAGICGSDGPPALDYSHNPDGQGRGLHFLQVHRCPRTSSGSRDPDRNSR